MTDILNKTAGQLLRYVVHLIEREPVPDEDSEVSYYIRELLAFLAETGHKRIGELSQSEIDDLERAIDGMVQTGEGVLSSQLWHAALNTHWLLYGHLISTDLDPETWAF